MRHIWTSLTVGALLLNAGPVQAVIVNIGSQSGNTITDEVLAYGWIRSDDPARAAGGETAFIGGTNGANDFRAYVAFDLSGFATADNVSSATISLFSEGASTFNANGGITNDANSIGLNVTALPEITGYGDGFGGTAVLDSDGTTPISWDNANGLYGAVLDTVTLDLDSLAVNEEVQLDVSAEVAAAVSGGASKITFGFTSPDAIATAARNFFAFEGVDQGAGTGGSIGPNLTVDFEPEFDIADVNQDGVVDTLDFQQISDDLFELTENLTGVNVNSDIDGSGLVDFTDFRIWKNTPQGAAVLAAMGVPEPATGALLCIVLTGFAFFVRRMAI